jgi:hypothetical protein
MPVIIIQEILHTGMRVIVLAIAYFIFLHFWIIALTYWMILWLW